MICDCLFLCPRCLISFVTYSLYPKTTAIGSSPLQTRMTTFPSGVSLGCIWDPMTFVAFWLSHSHTEAQPISACFLPRHHVYKKTDHRNVELTEVGPRFELKCEFGALVYAWGR